MHEKGDKRMHEKNSMSIVQWFCCRQCKQWTLNKEQRALNREQWTLNKEHWPRGAVYLRQEACPNQTRNSHNDCTCCGCCQTCSSHGSRGWFSKANSVPDSLSTIAVWHGRKTLAPQCQPWRKTWSQTREQWTLNGNRDHSHSINSFTSKSSGVTKSWRIATQIQHHCPILVHWNITSKSPGNFRLTPPIKTENSRPLPSHWLPRAEEAVPLEEVGATEEVAWSVLDPPSIGTAAGVEIVWSFWSFFFGFPGGRLEGIKNYVLRCCQSLILLLYCRAKQLKIICWQLCSRKAVAALFQTVGKNLLRLPKLLPTQHGNFAVKLRGQLRFLS